MDKLTSDLADVKVSNVSKSTFQWKVDVPEFVPRSMPVVAAAAPKSEEPKKNDAAPSSNKANNCVASSNSLMGTNPSDDPTVSFVNDMLFQLHSDPENIDQICAQMLDYVNTQISDGQTLTTFISTIIDAALNVENFTYLCMRVIVALNEGYTKSVENVNFRSSLLTALQTEHEKRGEYVKNPETMSRLYTFAEVLTDLSSNILIDGRPMKVLAKAVYELLDTIISGMTDESVRFAIQTCKSIGAHLESVEKQDAATTPMMNDLIDRLEYIGTMPNSSLKENTKFMIRNLRGVRRHWAYTAPAPAAAAPSTYNDVPHAPTFVAPVEVPVNYGNMPSSVIDPSGFYFSPESLSAEEAAFFERESGILRGTSSVSDSEVVGSDDDVIAEAYEAFLSTVHPQQRK